jgi:hypothetical protein
VRRSEGAERYGFAIVIAHADIKHVSCVDAVFVERLRDDAIGASEQVEVVDIGRAEIDLQR